MNIFAFIFNDFRISFGTGDSRSILRHTEHFFRKSLMAAISWVSLVEPLA